LFAASRGKRTISHDFVNIVDDTLDHDRSVPLRTSLKSSVGQPYLFQALYGINLFFRLDDLTGNFE